MNALGQFLKTNGFKEGDTVLVNVGGGNKNGEIAQKLLKLEVSGYEFASGIPGTLGGAIKMNAGAYGREMKDVVYMTTVMDYNGKIHKFDLDGHEFEYRKSIFSNQNYIILESILKFKMSNREAIESKMNEYAALRKKKQPFYNPSAGSIFKRGEDFITAELIDKCGLKGYRLGGALVSGKHAGFIINKFKASAQDVIDLIDYIKETIYEKTGKKVELEIEIVGEE